VVVGGLLGVFVVHFGMGVVMEGDGFGEKVISRLGINCLKSFSGKNFGKYFSEIIFFLKFWFISNFFF